MSMLSRINWLSDGRRSEAEAMNERSHRAQPLSKQEGRHVTHPFSSVPSRARSPSLSFRTVPCIVFSPTRHALIVFHKETKTHQIILVGSMTSHPIPAPHRSGWAHPPVASAPSDKGHLFRSRSASRFRPITGRLKICFMYLAPVFPVI